MMPFLNAHGFDPGPTQRPLLAGALSGLLGVLPASWPFLALGSFEATAHRILKISDLSASLLLLAAFVAAGAVYGGLFRRAANDRQGGWLFGLAFGFFLWLAAPVLVLPALPGAGIASGPAGVGYLATFLLWGVTMGAVFPFVHRPLQAGLESEAVGLLDRFGPEAAASRDRLLRRWAGRGQ